MKSPSSKPGAGAAAAGASAGKAGMNPQFGPQQSTMECPGSASQSPHWSSFLYPVDPNDQAISSIPEKPTPIVPCDVSTLKLDIVSAGKTHSISLASQRRQEAVAANVPGDYRYKLQHKDLVVEIIAPAEQKETTYSWGKPSTSKAAKGHEPVKITAKSTPKSSCGATHPEISVGADIGKALAKKPLKFDVFTSAPSGFGSSSWGRLWPFGDNRSKEIVIKADSCGFNPGNKVTKDLSILVVAIPDESWKITLGLGPLGSDKLSGKTKHNTGPDGKDTGAVFAYERKRGNATEEKSVTYVADSKFTTEYSSSTTSGKIVRDTVTYTDTPVSSDLIDQERKESTKLRKITIERTVGGQKVETDVSKTVNGILETIKKIEDLKKIFDGIPKVGWSIDYSFSYLSGKAYLEWGHRWPRNFSENNRVYYAERYISLGGEVELAAGSIEVMFGIEIDPWWAPVYFVAKLYLEVSASISISPAGTVSVTNWKERDLDLNPMDLDAKAEIKAKLGATAGGRILGYELRAELRLESSLTFDVDGKISRKGPEAKCSLVSDGAKIVGEIIEIGDIEESHRFKPVEVMKPKDIFKDKVIF